MNNLYTYLLNEYTWYTLIDALIKGYPISGYYDEDDVRMTIDYPDHWSYTFTVKTSMWYNALEYYTNKENNKNNINILSSQEVFFEMRT